MRTDTKSIKTAPGHSKNEQLNSGSVVKYQQVDGVLWQIGK